MLRKTEHHFILVAVRANRDRVRGNWQNWAVEAPGPADAHMSPNG